VTEPVNIMHAPIDNLTLEQLRERHRRACSQHLEEVARLRAELGMYWRQAMQQETDRAARCWELVHRAGNRQTISVDDLLAALVGQ
jgi:hypothetical protein